MILKVTSLVGKRHCRLVVDLRNSITDPLKTRILSWWTNQ